MKKIVMAFSGAALIGAFGAAAALADDGAGRAERRAEMIERMFTRLDVNGDGAIDRAEIETARAARFAAMDADGDGVISGEEMQAHAMERAAKRAGRHFDRLDANGDGGVDRAEMTAVRGARHETMFERMDADGDGSVTREEAATAKRRHRHGRRHAD